MFDDYQLFLFYLIQLLFDPGKLYGKSSCLEKLLIPTKKPN